MLSGDWLLLALDVIGGAAVGAAVIYAIMLRRLVNRSSWPRLDRRPPCVAPLRCFMLGREHCRPYVPEHFDRKKQKVGGLAHRKFFAVTDPLEELSQSLLKGLALEIRRAMWVSEIGV
jgi:hypothetical protein